MFTGIVAEVGRVRSARRHAECVDLDIEAFETAPVLKRGGSIAVNGVCQTVVEIAPPQFRIQAVGVTLERTTLGTLNPGSRVNLEPSLRIGDEIGGHLVTGHVDGPGRIMDIQKRGDAVRLEVETPPELIRFIAPRGSIALDGVSLTVAESIGTRIRISMIPHTLERTIASEYRLGQSVNLEVDLIARYLDQLLETRRRQGGQGMTLEKLMEKYA